MMPRLEVGDYLFAAKWPYGYSGASLPIDWPGAKGRLFGSLRGGLGIATITVAAHCRSVTDPG